MYAIHSVTRHPKNRTHRAKLPAAMRKRQFIGPQQRRLVPARPMLMDEEELVKNLEELRQKAAARILEVRTTDGRVVDLSTLEAAPAVHSPPLPHRRLDSVEYDKKVGQYIPPYVGDDLAMPQMLAPGEKPALLEQAGLDFAHPEAASSADEEAAIDAALAAASAPSAGEPVSLGEGKKGKKSGKR